jgi:hypothetical protein
VRLCLLCRWPTSMQGQGVYAEARAQSGFSCSAQRSGWYNGAPSYRDSVALNEQSMFIN